VVVDNTTAYVVGGLVLALFVGLLLVLPRALVRR
jgi:hypothetical protein